MLAIPLPWTYVGGTRGVGVEGQGHGVHAVALPGGGAGRVVEDVAQVGAAGGAADLGAHHDVAGVGQQGDGLGVGGVVEGGPTAARVELGGGAEQLGAAGTAAVDALAPLVQQGTGEGPLRAGLAQDVVLQRVEQGAPLGVGASNGRRAQ